LIDRFLAGQVQPMTFDGVLRYMGMTPDVMGDDPDHRAWAEDYRGRPVEGIAAAGPS
jgi:toluene monooxygenase system protein A